ncbi:uncharacterized protein LOC101448923 [Ceratitis capitata]|uniref:uncharacterized protein LOC101448923 n=1 Tax=Ceratitis capitata TaxID=7213 RepID=UPI0003296CEF|nr:uncharacterized protein LOC101448923 [Ceratitis capitata]
MAWKAAYFVLLSTLCVATLARPTQLDDIFEGYLKNVNLYNPEKQSPVLKRRIYEDNQDAGLKKVSLQSLIGDLEQNFFRSASNAGSSVLQTTETPDVSTNPNDSHPVLKRKTENDDIKKTNVQYKKESVEETTSADSVETTTEKFSSEETGTSRLQVEHISVQPHFGDLPIIPTFQVHHTKVISATFKDTSPGPTQITITKTNIHKAPVSHNEQGDVVKEEATTVEPKDHTEKAIVSNEPESAPTEPILPNKTKKTVSELKETEAELKEKVAEIEAEPIILSARV